MNVKYENIEPSNKDLRLTCIKSKTIEHLLEYPHVHDEMEIVYLINGNISVLISEEEQHLTAGDIIFINRLAAHHFYYISPDAEYILFQFKPHISYNSKKIDIKYLQPFYHTNKFTFHIAYSHEKSTALFADCIANIYQYSKANFAYELMLQSLLIKLLYLFYENDIFSNSDKELSEKSKAVKRIAKLEEYIEAHYASDLTVSFACEFVNLDYHYFSRLFKQETGKTFVEYVNFTRILRAQQLLAQTNHPVIYIAQSVGFPNITYFNRIFKSHCGLTPKQYRNAEKG
jgi:YesN/AraC family two-component response regulator